MHVSSSALYHSSSVITCAVNQSSLLDYMRRVFFSVAHDMEADYGTKGGCTNTDGYPDIGYYPENSEARTRPVPPGIAILRAGYPSNRRVPVNPQGTRQFAGYPLIRRVPAYPSNRRVPGNPPGAQVPGKISKLLRSLKMVVRKVENSEYHVLRLDITMMTTLFLGVVFERQRPFVARLLFRAHWSLTHFAHSPVLRAGYRVYV